MVDLINEFRDITKRAKLTERLFTLYELRNILNEKINKTEAKIIQCSTGRIRKKRKKHKYKDFGGERQQTFNHQCRFTLHNHHMLGYLPKWFCKKEYDPFYF